MFNKNIFYDEAISEKTRLGEFSKYKNKVDSNPKFYPSSNDSTFQKERRRLIKGISLGIGTSVLGTPFFLLAVPIRRKWPDGIASPKQDGKLGIALVGLGQYSANELAPALLETEHCYLAGIVTGTPSKIPHWQEKYNIPEKNVYNYENFDQIANNPDIDIVYVVLPNSMHAEFTIRAAKAKNMLSAKSLWLPMCRMPKRCWMPVGKMVSSWQSGIGFILSLLTKGLWNWDNRKSSVK
jgi:hypothetical protein